MPLPRVILDVLGATGTKFGCGIAYCGGDSRHVNGQPVHSCIASVGDIIFTFGMYIAEIPFGTTGRSEV
jgi:aerobic-type carbon monoxide dehydrogenase small subunit (CoxS/CutS family)